MNAHKYTIGVDFGTDSVRSLLVDVHSGEELATSVFEYPRWKTGLYCDPQRNQFRQHPKDYIEGLEHTIAACVAQAGKKIAENVCAISITTTGSTPVAVNEAGIPLAMLDEFSDNPDAMFFLWKDHSAIRESGEINAAATGWKQQDYLKYVGGIYSPEWFWAKLLYALRQDKKIREHCFAWVEHSDWIPFLLTGRKHAVQLERNVCAAGHKALWAAQHGGFPPAGFFKAIDPLLENYPSSMTGSVVAADQPAGTISEQWAARLGLPATVKVGIGAIDAHVGAIGAQIQPGYLTKIIGTSTCDILVVPKAEFGDRFIRGICGQVEGSVIPGMIGLEAGQAAFGDIYAWFKNLLMWPLLQGAAVDIDPTVIEKISGNMLRSLEEKAATVSMDETNVLAVDWFNGRRTPDADLELKAAILQLSLGTEAPAIYAALVEATCFGARKIIERFREQELEIKGIIGVGGISRKSKYVMQTMANVLNIPIRVNKTDQVCARGAAMLAATAAGCYPGVTEAMNAMGAGFDMTYTPDQKKVGLLEARYRQYETVCGMIEKEVMERRSR